MKHWVLVLLFTMAGPIMAADAPYYSHKKKGAIKGADVVAYWTLQEGAKAVMGSDEYTYEWQGITWKFANEKNRQFFIADPERYVPEFGGYCAYSVSLNFTNSIRPNSWSIVDGKLYLNYNSPTQRRFLKKSHELIANAEKNWPTVLSECEKKDDCNDY